MSDLRARLAGKARRRTTVSVAVADTTETVAAAEEAQRAWLFSQAREAGSEETERLEHEWTAAKARVADCYAAVEFQACSSADFEALQTDFTGKDGGIDPAKLAAHLPALAAACAVDEELRDEEFWREQLTGGSWSYGEQVSLGNRLLSLNAAAPDERVPFG